MRNKPIAEYVPASFQKSLDSMTEADLLNVLWIVMTQSPWFDEVKALESPKAVAEKVKEILWALKH